jgi:hypothetical protein
MSNTQQSAVALRVTIVAAVTGVTGDSLDQINSSKFPDGAEFFVLSNRSLYRLNKADTTPPVGALVVKPDGGTGNFILVPGGGGLVSGLTEQIAGTAAFTASGSFAVVQNTWIQIQAGANFYVATQVSDAFTVNTTTGYLSYVGPTGARFRVTASVSLASATAADLMNFAVTQNLALVGTTTDLVTRAACNADPTTPGLASQLTFTGIFTLTNADALAAVVRNVTGAHNLTATQFVMTVSSA